LRLALSDLKEQTEMPPTKDVQTFARRVALEALRPDEAVNYGVTAKDGFAIKQGDVIGVITASGKARRRSRTFAAGTGFAVNSPGGQVDDSSVFVHGDVLTLEDGTVIGTVDTIDATLNPNVVTLTGNAAVAVADDDAVLGSDGSQVAQGISDGATDGVDDTPINIFIAGFLTEALCRGLDASAKEELNGASVIGGIFKF
jgi:hypothetical protein